MNSHGPAVLPDNVLLEIFDFYRLAQLFHSSDPPWNWHRLAHVCRTWRDIIFASSCRLNLELLCTYRTPVRKTIAHLPALPIVIRLQGYVVDSDEDNIIAALEHPDRVRVVKLFVLRSLLGKMAMVMQETFPALTELWLESNEDEDMPVLPDALLGGCAPRLQRIYLNGIPFPAAPTLLLSARDLLGLDLRDIPDSGYISPEMMVASLAALPRLKYLTLRFRKGTSHPERIRLPFITRTVLPSLTTFDFDGLFEYSEDFVAQIDTPQLKNLNIDLDDDESVDFQIPQLCKFIDRSEHFTLSHFRRAQLDIWPSTVDIELDQSFRLSTQDVEISQVLGQISALLSNVDHLIIVSWSPEHEELLGDRIRWLELLHPFTAVKALGVRDKLSRRIVFALRWITGERAAEVLPALELLCLENRPVTCVKKFVAARLNTDHPVTVINERSEFQERLKSIVGE